MGPVNSAWIVREQCVNSEICLLEKREKKRKKKKRKTQNWKHRRSKCAIQTVTKCVFGKNYFCQIILLFSLFLQLFMSPTALFGTIHGSHCTISTNFYLYLQYFQQKVFSFSKINGSQISPISSQFINIDMTTFIEEKQTRMRKHDIKKSSIFNE